MIPMGLYFISCIIFLLCIIWGRWLQELHLHTRYLRIVPLLTYLTPFQTSHQDISPCIPYSLVSHSPNYAFCPMQHDIYDSKYAYFHIVQQLICRWKLANISRKIYNNEGSITDPVKGALLESYRTKMFLFDKDPHKRKIEREKIAVIKEPAN